jgi:hypothetical protein
VVSCSIWIYVFLTLSFLFLFFFFVTYSSHRPLLQFHSNFFRITCENLAYFLVENSIETSIIWYLDKCLGLSPVQTRCLKVGISQCSTNLCPTQGLTRTCDPHSSLCGRRSVSLCVAILGWVMVIEADTVWEQLLLQVVVEQKSK